MPEKAEEAVRFKHNGYNCCQAVLKVFSDETAMDDMTVKSIGSGFGNGMGCMESTCGALIGAVIVTGCMNKTERRTNAIARDILQEFKSKSGATVCRELKGIRTGKVLCSCDDCIRNAITAVENNLK